MQNKARDTYFDNLKTILIFFVVLGHFGNLHPNVPLVRAITNVIYSFHMPIFIFISGYFSKSIKSQRPSEIENVLYPYLVFQILNYFFTKLTGFGDGSLNIFYPTYPYWYLLGLIFWRVSIPYINFFNKKYSFFATIILSFTIGFFDEFNTFLALYRIIYFFPIFILGYYCSDLLMLLNRYSKYKFYFICLSLTGIFAIFLLSFFFDKLTGLIFLAYTPYSNYEHTIVYFFPLRVFGFLSSLLISFGLLFLVPHKKFRLTYLGENTLNIFLLHMFFVFPINNYLVNSPGYLILLVSVVSSMLICIILSKSIVNKILGPFTKLKQLKLLVSKKLPLKDIV